MTSSRYTWWKTPASSESFWLTRYRSEFVETLDRQGYCRLTVCHYRRMTDYLCKVAEARALGSDELNPEIMDDLAKVDPGTVADSVE